MGVAGLAPQGSERGLRLRLIGIVAVVSLLVFAPWAIRDWAVFGNPLPGQAATNALSLSGFDIFAWNHPPTLARYLAAGPGGLLEMRVTGLSHNLFNVLLFLGIPVSLIGLVALPWQGRDRALRPVLLVALLTFFATSLLFPVATTWGTFLHASTPVAVLLIVSALGALDAGIATLGRRLGWTRPVAWLGPLLAIFGSALFVALLPGFGSSADETARMYRVLTEQMESIGAPLDGSAPVVHDFPIWLAETERVPTLALPDEAPSDVLDLATHFGAKWLIVAKADHGQWPAVLDGGLTPTPRASRRSCCRSPPTRTTPRRSRASGCSDSCAPAWRSGRASRRRQHAPRRRRGARRDGHGRYTPRDGCTPGRARGEPLQSPSAYESGLERQIDPAAFPVTTVLARSRPARLTIRKSADAPTKVSGALVSSRIGGRPSAPIAVARRAGT